MRLALSMAVILCLMPMKVRAADVPQVELSAGYAFLSDEGEHFPKGVYGSIAFNLSDHVALVGDVGSNWKTFTNPDFPEQKPKATLTSFTGGLRGVARGESMTGFVQVLAGGVQAKASGPGSDNDSTTKFALQPGAGVQFRVTDTIGLEIGADYRRVFLEEKDANEYRARAGIVFMFGRRH